MRERTLKLVVTFGTTTRAMAMEKMCREQGLPGRLILCREQCQPDAACPGAQRFRKEKERRK